MKGGLWLTAMGRIVLDDHGYETFSEEGDTKNEDENKPIIKCEICVR